jgi:hypothetical protein
MRTVKWNAFLSGLCAFALSLGVVAVSAHADVTTEKGASILVFPKVRADDTYDTIIQITNTGNSMVHLRCFYVDATLVSTISGLPCSIPSATCLPSWQETDFTLWLTRQQPTHWLVSSGRNVFPFDPFGTDGAGFDPGRVPPKPDFEGELKCVEVTETEEPLIGNHLKGEATIKTISGADTGDVSKYNAIGIIGNATGPTPTNPLLLDGVVYNACPAKLIVNHFSEGAPDPVADEFEVRSFVSTELTLVPCSEDFENQLPTTQTVQFLIYNEFEERFSASTTVTCYLSTHLGNIDSPTAPFTNSVFSYALLHTLVAQTEITPVADTEGNVHAVIGVVERFVSVEDDGGQTARAAYNIHTMGDLIPEIPDQIWLTELQ